MMTADRAVTARWYSSIAVAVRVTTQRWLIRWAAIMWLDAGRGGIVARLACSMHGGLGLVRSTCATGMALRPCDCTVLTWPAALVMNGVAAGAGIFRGQISGDVFGAVEVLAECVVLTSTATVAGLGQFSVESHKCRHEPARRSEMIRPDRYQLQGICRRQDMYGCNPLIRRHLFWLLLCVVRPQ